MSIPPGRRPIPTGRAARPPDSLRAARPRQAVLSALRCLDQWVGTSALIVLPFESSPTVAMFPLACFEEASLAPTGLEEVGLSPVTLVFPTRVLATVFKDTGGGLLRPTAVLAALNGWTWPCEGLRL